MSVVRIFIFVVALALKAVAPLPPADVLFDQDASSMADVETEADGEDDDSSPEDPMLVQNAHVEDYELFRTPGDGAADRPDEPFLALADRPPNIRG